MAETSMCDGGQGGGGGKTMAILKFLSLES